MKSTDYNSLLNRMLYDSPLHTVWGKITFAVVLLITIYLALDTWIGWLTPLENGLIVLYGILIAFLGSFIGLVFLRYLDRRNPESWWFFVGILITTTLFTTAPAAYINDSSPLPTLTVGFNEEFWKVFPLLLLVFFAPTVVTGVRDGMIYGALGGFGFNLTEIATYILRTSFPAEGLDGVPEQLVRLGYWGIGSHVIWSVLVGAGIGLAVQTDKRHLKIAAPLGAYLLAVFTHTLQDNLVGPLIAIGLTLVLLLLQGVDIKTMNLQDQAAIEEMGKSYLSVTMPMEAMIINIINLPILFYALLKSGTWERQVIREELADEANEVITPEEYEGVKAEKRFRLRGMPGYSKRVGRTIRNAQNSLAFHKRYLKRKNRPIEGNLLAHYWRAEVARLRGGQIG